MTRIEMNEFTTGMICGAIITLIVVVVLRFFVFT